MQNSKRNLRVLVILSLLLFVHSASAAQNSLLDTLMQGEFLPGGMDTCLMCHRDESIRDVLHSPHGQQAYPQSPFAANRQQCQACHGPSQRHMRVGADGERPRPPLVFDKKDAADHKNAVCVSCHQQELASHWAGSLHEFEEVACSDCHQIHTQRDAVMHADSQNEVCYSCHRNTRTDFMRPSAHPVNDGLLGCMDCHQPHGSAGPAMLQGNNVNESCYQCHAEKRGPFLWEHAPVREDCSQCHAAHGSNHAALLQARTPWLCQQCHLAQFHPSTALSGTGAPPNGASQLLLNKDCMNCHINVHGSNHPSGAGLVR